MRDLTIEARTAKIISNTKLDCEKYFTSVHTLNTTDWIEAAKN